MRLVWDGNSERKNYNYVRQFHNYGNTILAVRLIYAAKDYDYYFHQDVTQVITANYGRNVYVRA